MELGIVGCGTIGTRVAEAVADHDRVSVGAACDTDEQRVEQFADEYGCPAFTDHTDLVTADGLDAVYVGVPPVAHVEVATDALAADTHVLCEKPLAATANAGESLVAREADTDRVTAVNLPFRYTRGFRALRERVLAGEIGDARRVELQFRFPQWPREWQDVDWLTSREQGGPLREVGTHFLFGVQELFGPIDAVSARVQRRDSESYERSLVGYFEVDDVHGTIDIACDHTASEENAITVLGTDGSLSLTEWYKLIADRSESSERELVAERTPTTDRLLDEFVAAVEGEGPIDGGLVSFAEANRVQRVVDALFASEGDRIELPSDPILRNE